AGPAGVDGEVIEARDVRVALERLRDAREVREAKPGMRDGIAVELCAAHDEHAVDVGSAAGLVQRLGQRARRVYALGEGEGPSRHHDVETPGERLPADLSRLPGPAAHDDRVALAGGCIAGDRLEVGEVVLELRPR